MAALTQNQMPVLPQHLEPGDIVGLVAPASAPVSADAIDLSLALLQNLGFKPVLGSRARLRHGFLAGPDRDRAGDLMRAFTDRRIRGIFCVRGGYGTARLLPLLDYSVIRRNPKVLVGFSDITSLQCAILKKSGLVSFHGPMTASCLIKKDCTPFSRQSLWRTVTEPAAPGSVLRGYRSKTVSIVRRGKVSGELIGGNLTVLSALIGTPWQPNFRNRILFIEEVDENPYRVDRLLTHLLNAGVLRQAAGVAVGVCRGCVDPKARAAGEYRQSVEDVLRERLRPLNVPVVIGLPFGHNAYNATLPVGGRAMLDGNKGDLIITRAAVR